MMRQSDSLEDLTLDETQETAIDDNDIDLDKELGLDESPKKETTQEKQKEKTEPKLKVETSALKEKLEKNEHSVPSPSAEKPQQVQQPQQSQQQQQPQQQQTSWWGGIWNTATQVVTTAASNPNEITKALQTAVSNTKIQEGIKTMSVAAKSVANMVEENVEKLIDAIDIDEDEEDSGQVKQRVIVTSTNPDDISLVAEVLETMYKEERFSVKGMGCESGIAKQPIGFENGVLGSQNRSQSILSHDAIQQMESFILVSIEQFVVKIGESWFESHCVYLFDKKSGKSVSTFSQMMPVSSKFVEKAIKLTPNEYPLKSTGASITVASLIEMDNSSKWQNGKDWYPSKTDGRMDKYTIMKMAIATVFGLNDDDSDKQ